MKLPLENYCINAESTIKRAMEVIDYNTTGAALVINDNKEVLGVITDGDIRRALIRGRDIKSGIQDIFNSNFKYATNLESKKKIKEIMLKNKIRQLPVIDENKRLVDIHFIDDLISYEIKDNYVFILAGGMGTRLRPLTENFPKPMLKVGDKPILEIIIEQFREYGFHNFILSLNYKGEIIQKYFGDGKKLNVNIEYVKEAKRLGTAGSIRLAKHKLAKPFIVINGDILTGIDFDAFLNHHINSRFDLTVGARNYEFTVPYGVMFTENLIIKELEEKPTYNFHINSGVYAINPDVVNFIPVDEFYNMTDLIDRVGRENKTAGIYQITEYWTDIGQLEDYRKANEDVFKFF